MIRSIIFLFLVISHFSLKADYRPVAIHEMIIKSEKIVYGEIVNLDGAYFEFKVDGSLTGDSGVLRIRRFVDWTCASRWTKYEKGQNLLLFLRSGNNGLAAMGAGNEGELPLHNNNIYINSMSLTYVNGNQNDWANTDFTFPGSIFDIQGGEFYGTKMELEEFLISASYIRKCMTFEYDEYYQIPDLTFKCNSKELNNNAKRSLLIYAILREAKERKNER